MQGHITWSGILSEPRRGDHILTEDPSVLAHASQGGWPPAPIPNYTFYLMLPSIVTGAGHALKTLSKSLQLWAPLIGIPGLMLSKLWAAQHCHYKLQ